MSKILDIKSTHYAFIRNTLIITFLIAGCDREKNPPASLDILDGWEISKITYEYGLRLRELFFVNEEVGYAVGPHGGAIFKTVDAGGSWNRIELGDELMPESFFFLDEQFGFVGGWIFAGRSFLLKTEDGGISWEEIFFDYEQIIPIYFSDGLNGLAILQVPKTQISGGKALAKTTNGGYNWEIVDLPVSEVGRYFYHVNDNTVFVVGQNNKIHKTSDTGDTWEIINTPDLGNIYFYNENFGFIGGFIGEERIVYKTINGGLSWDAMDFPMSLSPFFGLIHFGTETQGFYIERILEYSGIDAVTVTGNVGYSTNDGGLTWKKSGVVQPLDIQSVFSPKKDLVYGYNPNRREFYIIRMN